MIEVKVSDPKLLPWRANPTDAGADLRAANDYIVYQGETELIDTGVAVKIPRGWVGIVAPRSSMGKVRVTLANTIGVIDSDYRGNIKVLLVNEGEDRFVITAKDTRIAQLLIMPVLLTEFNMVGEEGWNDTARGDGGFGSTGT